MKDVLKRVVPQQIFSAYYWLFSVLGAFLYGFPSRKMIVIGITGTKGKTSTANFVWSCAMAAGMKAGIITTANIRIGEEESMNHYHMTMPGRFAIQRTMREMVKKGCKVCVVETTSEGLKQWRHAGIDYDVAIFTNLTPEHLPSHGGSFEAYKKAKGALFSSLHSARQKVLDGVAVRKIVLANNDSEHAPYYLSLASGIAQTFSLHSVSDIKAEQIQESHTGVTFAVCGPGNRNCVPYQLSVLGAFNVYNALPAIALMRLWGVSEENIQTGLRTLTLIPGRMEVVTRDGAFPATVIVDYAHEGQSMSVATDAARKMLGANGKLIVMLGAEGGGRDKAKRKTMGEIVARRADVVIVSDVDPYEDDPIEICEDIAKTVEAGGKKRGENVFVIGDRRAGIAKALSLAGAGDVILITGKGAEQSMVVKGGSIAWDDRTVVREEVAKLV
ncbi:MAG: UDP-N-acetylmuramoyl-L-alanyl-D-glutamate--2,6-diaminopimelate ligase [Patescibacteria group bacterium]